MNLPVREILGSAFPQIRDAGIQIAADGCQTVPVCAMASRALREKEHTALHCCLVVVGVRVGLAGFGIWDGEVAHRTCKRTLQRGRTGGGAKASKPKESKKNDKNDSQADQARDKDPPIHSRCLSPVDPSYCRVESLKRA